MARDEGYRLLKCFPAVQLGGVALLRAWAGPLPDLRFCPTGGLTPINLSDFLALPNVAMAGGSWLTPAAAVEAGRWQEITALARRASEIAALS